MADDFNKQVNGPNDHATAAETDWYDASLRVIDLAKGTDRILLHGDVAFGLPTGSPDGSIIAVVELSKEYMILTKSDSRHLVMISLATATLYLVMSVPLGLLSRYLESKWNPDED